ncbi:recombinase RecA [Brachyspira aalborgi]|jgi:recombination protein RecA|uniref:Protein RecA n=1 Tax=Brachyspira aalborgi TaxID=29522 RepID=A0A5C8E170_9SPIR|nr:recombinase RecA [Brachyspira aalborgi]CCY75786.1 protein RecA [Brachyspira sp. CAG:700]TXJ25160.1 recombinase RecA [Brachyspira aalborgi]TXJ31074.1 recombinase RecA [Brachyspira aalborgi]TXJ36742.1 recombinase RecA [Brachyspira aalborgi]TXJ40207.1 recombinase RecA [Brachyspira aalborgi]
MATAKKKENTEIKKDGKNEAIDAITDQINKKYGPGSFMRLGSNKTVNVDVISTGALTLDHALGVGGIPRGRITEIYGHEASGKTTLTLHIIAEAQKAGGYAAFIDAEHALDPTYASALGVDIDNLYISQPNSGEEALEILEKVVSSTAFDIVVVDSVAALVSRAELAGDIGDAHIALQARLMSHALRKLTAIISNTNTAVIFINQLRQNIATTGYGAGPTETTTGGKALKFYSSVRLDIRRTEWIKKGDETIGHKVKIKVVKNKLSAPFKVVNLEIIFGHGISTEGLLIDLAMEAKIITRSGAWFYYNGEQIAQGKEKVREILASDTKMRLELEIQIRENLNMGGIDKVKEELNEYLESQKNKDDKTIKSDKKEDGDLNKNSISNKDDTSDLLIKTVE